MTPCWNLLFLAGFHHNMTVQYKFPNLQFRIFIGPLGKRQGDS